MLQHLKEKFIEWITYEQQNTSIPLCDFERIRYELRPGDVLLIEGRSWVSEVIRQITQSSWSHACLYIGRLHDIDNSEVRAQLSKYFDGEANVQLVIEGYLGKGTIVSPIDNYRNDHIRICRPRALSRKDAQHVIAYAISKLGSEYDVRQIFDLARFLIPWAILPRRWRSTLFEYHPGESVKTVCSTMIAEAFESINFPILPVVKQHEETGIELFIRNPRLFTPRDFDYSPYFEIIKYPFISFADEPYRNLPWNQEGLISHDGKTIPNPGSEKPKSKLKIKLNNKKERKKPSPAPTEKDNKEDLNNESTEKKLPFSPIKRSKSNILSYIVDRFY